MTFFQEPPRIAVGDTVPDVAFIDSANRLVRLRDLRGKVVVLEFSALSCPPCRTLETKMDVFAGKHMDVVFLEVSVDPPDQYAKFVQLRKKGAVPLVHDPYDPDRKKMNVWKFGDVATPTLLVIDKNCKFASRPNIGPDDPTDWLDYRIKWAKKHS